MQYKILVIDDNPLNRESANMQLKDHDLTVVGSYIEGQKLLGGGDGQSWDKANEHSFNVVLCDLMLPASSQYLGPKGDRFVGQLMPIGIFLAILAAKNTKQGEASYIAVLTDQNHHDHPASACFDAFNQHPSIPTEIGMGSGSTVLLCNDPNMIETVFREGLKPLDDDGWAWYRNHRAEAQVKTTSIKRWDLLLKYLFEQKESA